MKRAKSDFGLQSRKGVLIMYDMLQMRPKIVKQLRFSPFSFFFFFCKVSEGARRVFLCAVAHGILVSVSLHMGIRGEPDSIRGDAVTYKSIVSAGVNVYTGVSAARQRTA